MSCTYKNIAGLPKCPFAMLMGLGLISFLALAAAFASEIFLGLEPCILCIYQRWPFAIVIALAVIGMAACKKAENSKNIGSIFVGLSGLTLAANGAIAFYHTGVEQKWWVSAVEGCAVPQLSGNTQNWIENIMSAPTANCAEIPWQDPIIGLSMANYNVLLGFGLAALCAYSVWLIKRKKV